MLPLCLSITINMYNRYFLLLSSDMDVVVIGEWDTLPLHSLAQDLLENGVCFKENIQVLDKASVSYMR